MNQKTHCTVWQPRTGKRRRGTQKTQMAGRPDCICGQSLAKFGAGHEAVGFYMRRETPDFGWNSQQGTCYFQKKKKKRGGGGDFKIESKTC